MSELEELYHDVIMDHARRPATAKKLSTNLRAQRYNAACGDVAACAVKADKARITDVECLVSGCILCRASGSIACQELQGKSINEVRMYITSVKDLVTKNVQSETLKASDVTALQGVVNFPNRIACVLLPWLVFEDIINKSQPVTKNELMRALATVQDPELRESIVDLGLIYNVSVSEQVCTITMTLTTPFCPLAPEIDHMIRETLDQFQFTMIEIKLVWDPPWDPGTMASDRIKDKLGLW